MSTTSILSYGLCVHFQLAGFWGGLVPENAYNATVLEELLEAGALGLKVLFKSRSVFDLVKFLKGVLLQFVCFMASLWSTLVNTTASW
jgi:hypothetical protein